MIRGAQLIQSHSLLRAQIQFSRHKFSTILTGNNKNYKWNVQRRRPTEEYATVKPQMGKSGFGLRKTKFTHINGETSSTCHEAENFRIPLPEAPPKTKVSMVFLGETGTGKTTLLQAVEDWLNGTPYEERCMARTRSQSGTQGQSQTKKTRQFVINNHKYVVCTIDTPGIGDTEGFEADRKHADDITQFLSHDCEFNAICILVRNGTNRVTTTMQYVISEIKTHLPKELIDNIVVIVTRCPDLLPSEDTESVIEQLGLPTKRMYMIDNCAYEAVSPSRLEKIGESSRRALEMQKKNKYYQTHEQLESIVHDSSELLQHTGDGIRELKKKRCRLYEILGVLEVNMDIHETNQRSIDSTVQQLNQIEQNIANNKDYSQEVTQTIQVKIDSPTGRLTMCGTCRSYCHDPCYLNWAMNPDVDHCACMDGNKCRVCNHDKHAHMPVTHKFEEKQEIIVKVDESMKNKHMQAQDMMRQVQEQLENSKLEIARIEGEIKQICKSIRETYQQIQQQAMLSFNFSFEKYAREKIEYISKRDDITTTEQKRMTKLWQDELEKFLLHRDQLKHY